MPKLPQTPWGRASGAIATARGYYAQYGKYVGLATLVYGALAPKSSPSKKRTPAEAPLTVPNVGALEFPQAYALPQTQPARDKCHCKKPKKRGPRKLRTVCYKGSYTETARGTSKRKREQIPCRV
jgi:hypothetical protein